MKSSLIKERLREVLKAKGDTVNSFAKKADMSQRTANRQVSEDTSINYDLIDAFARTYTDIDLNWLLTGTGDMIKADEVVKTFVPDELPKQVGRLYRAPIYQALPVSAGSMGLVTHDLEEPSGYAYTTMPDVTFFPVVGYSFEPIIPAGHYVGIRRVDNWQSWERIDPEKIFLIVTHDDRMIKRIRVDKEDSNKLWCVSPNYDDFDIMKMDVLEIHHVFFYGKMI